MAHVTRIKAADKTSLANDKTTKTSSAEKSATAVKNKAKTVKVKQHTMPKWLRIITTPFHLIFKPFAMLGRYIHDSWLEIRQVRWPNRKATWKMVGAIFIYSAFFIILVALLDALFNFIFSKIIR